MVWAPFGFFGLGHPLTRALGGEAYGMRSVSYGLDRENSRCSATIWAWWRSNFAMCRRSSRRVGF
ncbi:hypothetical protein ADK53_02410 [Streptomyces sp. WM6373]|nr:hypothetical protein ADK53_02410 [Streptomyces sp. WM6373]